MHVQPRPCAATGGQLPALYGSTY